MNARRFVVVLLALMMAGCSKSPSSPAAPAAPSFPSVLGVYSSASRYTMTLTVISTGQQGSGSCRGSMTISNQSGASFSGSFVRRECTIAGVPADIEVVSGNVINGTVRVDGGVSFNLQVPGQDPAALAITTGCTTTSIDALYTAALTGNLLTGTLDSTAMCDSVGAISLRYVVSGSR